MKVTTNRSINEIWEQAKDYLRIRLDIIRLLAIEKTATIMADLVSGLALFFLMLTAFLVACITLAFYLSHVLGSFTRGFGCAAVFFMVIALLVLFLKDKLESVIADMAIQRYFAKHCTREEQTEPPAKPTDEPPVKPTENKSVEKIRETTSKENTMEKRKVTLKGVWEVLKNAFTGFSDHKVTKLSGSLAYYTVFSMAPLLVVIISLCGIFLGQEAAQGQVYAQLDGFLGKDTALQLQDLVKKAAIGDKGIVAVVIGGATLLIGATTVFGDIQDSINTIWGLKPKPKRGWLKMLQNRFLSFSVIISLGFLLLVSLAVTTVLDGFSHRLQTRFEDVSVVLFYILNQVVTLAVVSLIFGVIFKVLPDAIIKWKDVFFGSVVTALLFMLGKFGISIYIGQSDVGSTYGAAGSLVVLLLWTYYSSIILYFGAEFTKAYAIAYGSEIHPSHYAVTTKEVEIETGNTSVQQNNT
ncbi:YihY/virulence factor BrkB family protein [Pedobacter sp. MC2016-24]|uniref:YihY/virulence factor BrkB family protein n=1 Tax=Pedobacter sp. MC2016-24 TaxID=2780090 RepID=UPI001D168941|nr:YihY/virulence factor BrkB family protein [Pedobacter sp. MC2016-24]